MALLSAPRGKRDDPSRSIFSFTPSFHVSPPSAVSDFTLSDVSRHLAKPGSSCPRESKASFLWHGGRDEADLL
ncbi:hypothetical protein EYF80_034300 [Liparis tanakae]|uniref:Uncharacterized protein n=1 Tax=Liparis tanakae TaxID=230148 RepID=A0A4Z2GP94_9TELE|nr:hypothetical protein EYF80_034300 [Liparis tanakae]